MLFLAQPGQIRVYSAPGTQEDCREASPEYIDRTASIRIRRPADDFGGGIRRHGVLGCAEATRKTCFRGLQAGATCIYVFC